MPIASSAGYLSVIANLGQTQLAFRLIHRLEIKKKLIANHKHIDINQFKTVT